MRKFLLLSAAISILWSCKRDAIDFDNFKDLSVSPALQTPLAKATLTLSDFVVTDSVLKEDPDGGLRIIFNQENIFSLSVIDFIDIPEQSPTTLPVVYNPNGPALDVDLALGTLAGAELAEATFNTGFLVYEVKTAVAVNSDVEVRLTIKNATLNGSVFDNLITLPTGTTSYVDSVDISGLVFDLSNGGTAKNFFGLLLDIEKADSATAGHLFSLEFNFKNLGIDNAKGFFGHRAINIPDGSFDFDISALKDFANGFFLTNPNIKMKIDNGLGIELDLDLDLLGVNGEGTVQDLGLQKQSIVSPINPGDVANSTIDINKNNSEIVNFLASLPQTISYGGVGTLNPSAQGGGTVANFIDKSSFIRADLEIDLPLEFRADNMSLEQFVDFSVGGDESGDNSQTDQIETLTLFFRTINGFPFDVNLDVTFLDTVTGDSLDGIKLDLLTAAPVDGGGRVTQKMTSDGSITFTSDKIDGLLKSNKLRINATLNTSNNGQTSVKLYTDYDLEIQFAVETSLNIDLNNEK